MQYLTKEQKHAMCV